MSTATSTRQPPDVAEPESALEEARGYLWRALVTLERIEYTGSIYTLINVAAIRVAELTDHPPSTGPKHLPRSLR